MTTGPPPPASLRTSAWRGREWNRGLPLFHHSHAQGDGVSVVRERLPVHDADLRPWLVALAKVEVVEGALVQRKDKRNGEWPWM